MTRIQRILLFSFMGLMVVLILFPYSKVYSSTNFQNTVYRSFTNSQKVSLFDKRYNGNKAFVKFVRNDAHKKFQVVPDESVNSFIASAKTAITSNHDWSANMEFSYNGVDYICGYVMDTSQQVQRGFLQTSTYYSTNEGNMTRQSYNEIKFGDQQGWIPSYNNHVGTIYTGAQYWDRIVEVVETNGAGEADDVVRVRKINYSRTGFYPLNIEVVTGGELGDVETGTKIDLINDNGFSMFEDENSTDDDVVFEFDLDDLTMIDGELFYDLGDSIYIPINENDPINDLIDWEDDPEVELTGTIVDDETGILIEVVDPDTGEVNTDNQLSSAILDQLQEQTELLEEIAESSGGSIDDPDPDPSPVTTDDTLVDEYEGKTLTSVLEDHFDIWETNNIYSFLNSGVEFSGSLPTYTIDVSALSLGSYTIDLNDYQNLFDIISAIMIIGGAFVGIRFIIGV